MLSNTLPVHITGKPAGKKEVDAISLELMRKSGLLYLLVSK